MNSQLTEQERKYIKSHKAIPKSVLERELEIARNDILDAPPEERDSKVNFAKWLRDWLEVLDILDKPEDKGKNKDSYV